MCCVLVMLFVCCIVITETLGYLFIYYVHGHVVWLTWFCWVFKEDAVSSIHSETLDDFDSQCKAIFRLVTSTFRSAQSNYDYEVHLAKAIFPPTFLSS
jgi:hypothetical protein